MDAARKRFWSTARKIFRWLRITAWFILLVLICAAVYFNTVGLPDFLKRPLLAKIREQGWQVEFSNMRWPWYRQIVIENPSFTRNDRTGPGFSAARAELNVHWSKKSNLQIRSLTIDAGQLRWAQTNGPTARWDDIKTTLVFHRDGRLELAPLQARFRGAQINVRGVLTNAAALRELSFSAVTNKAGKADFTDFLNELEKVEWTKPVLNLTFRGDARELPGTRIELSFSSRRILTRFGRGDKFKLVALWKPTSKGPTLTVQVSADDLETPWASGKKLRAAVHSAPLDDSFALWKTETEISAEDFQAHAKNNSLRLLKAQFYAEMTNALDRIEPLHASGELRLAESMMCLIQPTPIDARFTNGAITFVYQPASRKTNNPIGDWEKLRPFTFHFSAVGSELKVPEVHATNFLCVADWSFPELAWKQIKVVSDAGSFASEGSLNVETRKISAHISSDFDAKRFQSRLSRNGQRFLSQFDWERPPQVIGQINVTLPEWENKKPDWRNEVLPTLTIDGKVSGKNTSFRKINALSATTDLHYSNLVWQLPNLHIFRPEGELKLGLTSDDRTLDFRFVVDSEIDPKIVRGQLLSEAQKFLDDCTFAGPPQFRGEIWGRWNAPEKTGLQGKLSATNVVFRGTRLDNFSSVIALTNKLLALSNSHVEQNGGQIDAPEIKIDFQTGQFSFHQLTSTVDPMLIVRTLRIPQAKYLEPYHFARPPQVLLNGSFKLNSVEDADMRFSVSGNNFEWRELNLDRVSAELHWLGNKLILTNAQGFGFGPGQMSGWAFLNFLPDEKMNYRFGVSVGNVDVQPLARNLQLTNKVEGALSGYFFINSGDLSGLESWHGAGHLELREGLLWELPIFGIFSPIIDTMLPGVGTSRARDATGDFVVNNGVFTSEKLEIRASTFRMQYRGSIDAPQQRIAARVNAEILRDTWGVGPLVSLALMPLSKLFEYEINGPLKNPNVDPVYVPKFLMMTLRPFHSMKKALMESESQSQSPPQNEPTPP